MSSLHFVSECELGTLSVRFPKPHYTFYSFITVFGMGFQATMVLGGESI